MRSEFTAVAAGFALLPTLAANGNKVVTVNAGGTALTATSATALSGLGTMSAQNANNVAITGGTIASNNVAITGGSITGITDLAVADGGTGSSTAANARTALAVVGTSELSASNGTSLVGFIQTGTGATARTLQAKARDVVHVKDFGATCDGTGNDVAALDLAVAAVTVGGTILVSGTPRVTSVWNINKCCRILFDGALGINASNLPSSYIIKGSAMTGAAVELSQAGARAEGGGVVAEVGATGPNIKLSGNSTRWDNGFSYRGTYGFHVDGTGNANHWRLDHCRANTAATHGLFVNGGVNCNSGTAIGFFAQSCGGDAIHSDTASWNTYLGCGGDTNTGWGFVSESGLDNTLIGGDFEGNTAGNIWIKPTERFFNLVQKNNSLSITDQGYYTRRLDRATNNEFTFTPCIRGSTGATKAVTGITVVGTTATVAAVGHGYSNGDTVLHSAFVSPNMNGAFAVTNVAANAYDVTVRSDRAFAAPVTGAETATAQKCGAASVKIGRYTYHDGWIEFSARITLSSVTNITGIAQFILPATSRSIDSNLFCNAQISYYTGITHANKLEVCINDNADSATFFHTIGGAPGVAVQFNASGLSATADMIITGRYFIVRDN